MNKQEFLSQLRQGLSGLPQADLEERISFFCEAIDDRMEEGRSEEDAVAELGDVGDVIAQILEETPIVRLVKERIRPKRRMRAWEILLLILGFPVWFPLLLSVFAVILSLNITLWTLVVSLWAVFGALVGSALGGVAGGTALICTGIVPAGLVLIGGGVILAGLSIFTYFGCIAATKGTAILSKNIVMGIKKCFVGKEKAE